MHMDLELGDGSLLMEMTVVLDVTCEGGKH